MNPRTLDVVGREDELAAIDAVLEAVCDTVVCLRFDTQILSG